MTSDDVRIRYVKIGIIFYLVWVAAFILEGFYAVTLPATDLTLWVDTRIPVVPEFVWVYVSCYVYPFVTLFVVRDWHRFNRALLSIALCTIVAFIGHVAVPVAFVRPNLGTSFSAQMLTFIYDNDFKPGAQNFPSLHVAIALVVYLTCRKQALHVVAMNMILIWALLIVASTVLIRQHLFVDLVGGLVLGTSGWGFISWAYRRTVEPDDDPIRALRVLTRTLAPMYMLCALCLVAVGIVQALH